MFPIGVLWNEQDCSQGLRRCLLECPCPLNHQQDSSQWGVTERELDHAGVFVVSCRIMSREARSA